MFQILTPVLYWILTVLWLIILVLYLTKLRQSRVVGGAVALLLTILAIDAFRTVIESAYFGLMFNSQFGLLPDGIYRLLSHPSMIVIPKLINVVAGVLVLFLLVRRWLPQEIREREQSVENLQTAKDEAERQASYLEAMFNGVSDAIVFTDTARRIVSVNRGMGKVFGYGIDDLAGKTTAVLYESEEEYERQGRIRFHLTAAEKAQPYVVRYRRKNGEVFPGETIGTVIHNRAGGVLGYIGVIRDVTEREQVEVDLRTAKEEAEHASQAKSEFLAHMSHDLRTPLNSILGFSEAMEKDMFGPIGDPRYHDYADMIHRSGRHLLDMINDILDLSRIENDEYILDETVLDMRDEVAAAIRRCAPSPADTPTSTVSANVADAAPWLFADQRAVGQILDNLVTNALKHAGDGADIVVGWRANAAGDGCLSVADNGCGIPASQLGNITAPFVQGGSARSSHGHVTRPSPGVGLGLSIVTRLAALHGARFDIDSTEGVGTMASVVFPKERLRPGG